MLDVKRICVAIWPSRPTYSEHREEQTAKTKVLAASPSHRASKALPRFCFALLGCRGHFCGRRPTVLHRGEKPAFLRMAFANSADRNASSTAYLARYFLANFVLLYMVFRFFLFSYSPANLNVSCQI